MLDMPQLMPEPMAMLAPLTCTLTSLLIPTELLFLLMNQLLLLHVLTILLPREFMVEFMLLLDQLLMLLAMLPMLDLLLTLMELLSLLMSLLWLLPVLITLLPMDTKTENQIVYYCW